MDNRKKGALIAAVALVAVLALAFLGYRLLSDTGNGGDGSYDEPESSAQDAESPEDDGDSSESPMLADYDPTVYTESGEAISFTQIADGKPLVVNFWATWCPYCIEEFPDYQRIFDEYSDRVSFAFVDATDGKRETAEYASRWLRNNGYSFPGYYDADGEAMYTYGIAGLPTTVVVSGDGEILAVSSGMIDPIALRKLLDSLV